MTLLLRPRNFFASNPVMNVPPSYSSTPSQILAGGKGIVDGKDRGSRLAFGGTTNGSGNGKDCCDEPASNGSNGASNGSSQAAVAADGANNSSVA
jgi:primary-amine oxidase